MTRPLGSASNLWRSLVAARRPVLFLDVDGTLAPFVARPPDARVPHPVRRALSQLRQSGARVILVSGRRARDAARVAGGTYDGVLGNHGAERLGGVARLPGADSQAGNSYRPMLALLRHRLPPGARLEEKGHSAAVHHRWPARQAARVRSGLARLLSPLGYQVLQGRRVLDVRLKNADKGRAVLACLAGLHPPPDVVLYAGDDTTDQDAFRRLGKRAHSVAVSRRVSGADYRSSGPAAFGRWLVRLARARSDTSAGRVSR